MKRVKSGGRETRSKSKARKRSPSPESYTEDQIEDNSTTEKSSRSSSRMSRRDSYEKTLIQKSAEKSNSSRSLSQRKSNSTAGQKDGHVLSDTIEYTNKKEEPKGKEVMPRRKSSRRRMDAGEENKDADSEKLQDTEKMTTDEESNLKGCRHMDDTTKKLASRRKSKRVFDTDNEKDVVNSTYLVDSNENDKNKRTRKSKRFAVKESDMETDETASDDHLPLAPAKSDASDQPKEVIEPRNEAEAPAESKGRDDRRSKRKSRRATKALFTADDVDVIMEDTNTLSGHSADGVSRPDEKVRNSNKQTKDIREAENERRGTFVLNKQPMVIVNVDKNIEDIIQKDNDKDKKNRRGTFVVPTAPPPAPRPKKTISNIPILEGRIKPVEQKEVKKRLDQDRRGTYFVTKPVTPYLDVENIDDIADSILISSTDDDSQVSAALPRDIEEEKFHEEITQSGNVPKRAIAPSTPSSALQPGETTVLEPQDMELTEALTGVNWSRFSAPEPDFLKKVSPGPTRTTDEFNATVTERHQGVNTENHSEEESRSDVIVAESDFEEEKQQTKEKRKSTKLKNKSKVVDRKEDSNNSKTSNSKLERETTKELIEIQKEGNADKEVDKQEKPKKSRSKFRLLNSSEDTLGPSDTESVTTASEVSNKRSAIGDDK